MFPEMDRKIILNNQWINSWYKEQYQKLADIYCNGELSMVRKNIPDESNYLAEYYRALNCIIISGFDDLSKYAILDSVLKDVIHDLKSTGATVELPDRERESNRKQKYNQVVSWCKENAGKEVKVKDVADLVEWSYPTANNFVQDRLDLFTRVSRGVYILRNPDQERAKEKNAAKN